MSKVIEIKKHIALEQQKKKEAEQLNLVKPLLHFLQCSSCIMKCCRCGSAVDTQTDNSAPPNTASFPFCSDCKTEYLAYQRSKLNDENADTPWKPRLEENVGFVDYLQESIEEVSAVT